MNWITELLLFVRNKNCIFAGDLSGADANVETIQPTIQIAISEIVKY